MLFGHETAKNLHKEAHYLDVLVVNSSHKLCGMRGYLQCECCRFHIFYLSNLVLMATAEGCLFQPLFLPRKGVPLPRN